MKVGFIGLGIMGKPMSKNLLKAGHELVVYNRSKASVEELCAAGAKGAESPAEVAKECKVIITMVPNSPQVREVCLGENGIVKGRVQSYRRGAFKERDRAYGRAGERRRAESD